MEQDDVNHMILLPEWPGFSMVNTLHKWVVL